MISWFVVLIGCILCFGGVIFCLDFKSFHSFFSSLCSLVGCLFIYIYLYLFFISFFNCCWLVCYKRHSQNVIHNRIEIFCSLITFDHKERDYALIGVRFEHINFGFNWTKVVSDIWSIMCEMGMLHRTVCMHLVFNFFKILILN